MQGTYADEILDDSSVCSNCFRQIRVDRIDPHRSDTLNEEWVTRSERHKRNTTIEYGPADRVSEQKGTFCQCGVESARERIWSDEDVDADRFRGLIQHVIETLEAKGVTLKRQETAAYALQARRDGTAVDAALAQAVDAGIVAAVASSREDTAQPRA
jgi:hypothetical protein